MKLSGKGAGNQEKMFVTGEIKYRAVFIEASRILNPSVPYRFQLALSCLPKALIRGLWIGREF